MKTKKILVCDGTVDGIFTAVYRAYDLRYGHENIKIIEEPKEGACDTFELFAEYIHITTDMELSVKVGISIIKKISATAYEYVIRAALSQYKGRSDVIYRFLILGYHMGKDVLDYLSNDSVNQLMAMNRNVGMECHHLLGFLRFKEMDGNLLYSVIRPKNDVLTLITPHFVDRLRQENFMIVDEGRGTAAIHRKGDREVIYVTLREEERKAVLRADADDEGYEQLWKCFVQSISIKERENKNLQRNNLPLRFRPYMTEFKDG